MPLLQTTAVILWKVGILETIRKAWGKRARFVLVMHGVAETDHPDLPKACQPHHTRAEMQAVLSWLGERYTFLSPDAFLTTSQPGVLLTFDDGFANNQAVLLPLLEAYNAPAVFFVTLQHIHDPHNWLPATRQVVSLAWPDLADVPAHIARDWYDGMSLSQLRECAAHPLVTIGSHTHSHPFLSQCDEVKLAYEIGGSKTQLENLIGTKIDLFAYPTGDYNAQTIVAVQQAGYQAAFAVDRKGLTSLRYEIPRVGIYDSHPAYLGLKLSGLHRCPLKAAPLLVD